MSFKEKKPFETDEPIYGPGEIKKAMDSGKRFLDGTVVPSYADVDDKKVQLDEILHALHYMRDPKTKPWDDAILACIKLLSDHRTALEAGMRKPLRWKMRNDVWVLLNTSFNPMVQGKSYIFCYTKKECIEFANDLGMTAEFLEDESNE